MIHDGSSSPSLTLPHTMGEGEGGGPFLVKWKISDDLSI